MSSASLGFLAAGGACTGAAVLDVGCGDGQVTLQLSRLVGPSGRVLGIDIDRDAVDIARRAAAATGEPDGGSGRVAFRDADAAVPAGVDEFDLAYSRLLLSHLVDPMAVVRAMRTAVKSGATPAPGDRHQDGPG